MSEGWFDLAHFLATVPGFRALTPELRERVARGAEIRRFVAGSTVFAWKEQSTSLVVVRRGELSITRPAPAERRRRTRRLGPGSVLGWSVVAGERHAANLVAATDLTVALIPGRTIQAVARDDPTLPFKMLAEMGAHVSKLSDELTDLRFKTTKVRVLEAIRVGCNTQGETRWQITPAELSEQLGVSPERVNQVSGVLAKEGLIQFGEDWVELAEPTPTE